MPFESAVSCSCVMRSGWSPSVVPAGVHDTVYLAVDCHGDNGCIWREADISGIDFENVIADLMRGKYSDPQCVVAFNATEN